MRRRPTHVRGGSSAPPPPLAPRSSSSILPLLPLLLLTPSSPRHHHRTQSPQQRRATRGRRRVPGFVTARELRGVSPPSAGPPPRSSGVPSDPGVTSDLTRVSPPAPMAWHPTHVNVLVRQARSLGREANAYVTFSLGTQLYRTSVQGPSCDPKWLEECTLDIERWSGGDGNGEAAVHDAADEREGGRAKKAKARHSPLLVLAVMHRVTLGADKCLGKVVLALEEIYRDKARARAAWHALVGGRGDTAGGRGELEVTISFLRSTRTGEGASGAGEDMKNGPKESVASPRRMSLARSMSDLVSRRLAGAPLDEPADADTHTHRRSSSASNHFTPADPKSKLARSNSAVEGHGTDAPTADNGGGVEFETRPPGHASLGKPSIRPQLWPRPPEAQGRLLFRNRAQPREGPTGAQQQRELATASMHASLDNEKLRNLSRADLVALIIHHKEDLVAKDDLIRSMEDYIDTLLLRVMEHTPCLLRVPYTPCSPRR
uniref:Rab11 family-interacting protein 1-like isoform X1 n=2 Tax=Petromyzon marinus TaxID=7757 RepID=A0AAJ7WLY0_PETMA|nr:rab11 family-interacting protein 1-like isoform X1 [Petromyzon marinus]